MVRGGLPRISMNILGEFDLMSMALTLDLGSLLSRDSFAALQARAESLAHSAVFRTRLASRSFISSGVITGASPRSRAGDGGWGCSERKIAAGDA